METSLFWDAQENSEGVLDRVYNSDDFAAMFMGFWGDGLIPGLSQTPQPHSWLSLSRTPSR